MPDLFHRPRRLRRTENMRALVRETRLAAIRPIVSFDSFFAHNPKPDETWFADSKLDSAGIPPGGPIPSRAGERSRSSRRRCPHPPRAIRASRHRRFRYRDRAMSRCTGQRRR